MIQLGVYRFQLGVYGLQLGVYRGFSWESIEVSAWPPPDIFTTSESRCDTAIIVVGDFRRLFQTQIVISHDESCAFAEITRENKTLHAMLCPTERDTSSLREQSAISIQSLYLFRRRFTDLPRRVLHFYWNYFSSVMASSGDSLLRDEESQDCTLLRSVFTRNRSFQIDNTRRQLVEKHHTMVQSCLATIALHC